MPTGRRCASRARRVDKIYNNLATVVDALPFHPDDEGTIKRLAGWLTAKTMREIGVMVTGGSSSIKDLWLPMRQAGASARADAGRGRGRRRGSCRRAKSRCSTAAWPHPSGKSASFGELAAAAAKLPLPRQVALKDPKDFKLIGQPRGAAGQRRQDRRQRALRPRRGAARHAVRQRQHVPHARRQRGRASTPPRRWPRRA